jgi:hypothetical protein
MPEEIQQQTQTPPANPEPPKEQPKKAGISDAVRAKFLGLAARLEDKPKAPPAEPEQKPQDPPKETPSEDPAKKAAEPAKLEEKPKEEPKKKQAAPKVMKAPPSQDPNVIAKAAAEAAVAAVEASRKQTPAAAKEPEAELPKDIARKLDYYKELEGLDPKYKGLTQKVVEFSKKGGIEERYVAEWEKANPGQKFDADDEAHTSFYEKYSPDYDEDDLEVAKEQVIERRAVDKAKKAMEPKLQEQQRKAVEESSREDLDSASAAIATSTLEAINKDLLTIAQEKGDAGLQEEDPLALQVATEVMPRHEAVAHEAIRLFRGLANPSDRNPVHSQISEIALGLNEAIAGVVAQDPRNGMKPVFRGTRVVGYQQFAPLQEYASMSAEERKAHWTVGEDEVLAHIKANAGREAKSRYDQITAAAQKTFGSKTRQGQPASTAKPDASKPTETTPAVKSPTIGSGSSTPTPTAGESSKAGVKSGSFAKAWAGR